MHLPHKHMHKCAHTHTLKHTTRRTHRLPLRSAPTTHERTHTHTEHNSPAKAGAQRTHAPARALVTTHAGARALRHFDTHLSALAFSQTNRGPAAAAAADAADLVAQTCLRLSVLLYSLTPFEQTGDVKGGCCLQGNTKNAK